MSAIVTSLSALDAKPRSRRWLHALVVLGVAGHLAVAPAVAHAQDAPLPSPDRAAPVDLKPRVTPQTTVDDTSSVPWSAGEHRLLFWTGAGLFLGSFAVAAGGALVLKQDGKVACDAPAGAVCQHLYATKVPGWLLIGAAAELAIGGISMMVMYHGDPVRLTLSPGGVAGRF